MDLNFYNKHQQDVYTHYFDRADYNKLEKIKNRSNICAKETDNYIKFFCNSSGEKNPKPRTYYSIDYGPSQWKLVYFAKNPSMFVNTESLRNREYTNNNKPAQDCTPEIYFEICKFETTLNPRLVKAVDWQLLTSPQRKEIAAFGIYNNAQFIEEIIKNKQFFEKDDIITFANYVMYMYGGLIRFLNDDIFTPEEYYTFAMRAVKINGANLEFIDCKRLDAENYKTICEIAIRKNKGNAKFI